ncbi:MAG: DinB family protein [Bacteroidota bacterium]
MIKSKEQIITELGESFNSLCVVGKSVSDEGFNIPKADKWTPAENIAHLVRATKMTSLAFTLPKFLHVVLYGKPNRTSHGYTKIVDNYHKKLEGGAQASGVYLPKKASYQKEKLTSKLNTEGEKLIKAVNEKWSDEQLDQYQISHPILGLLTIRELAYFTIYHNGHHLESIKKHYL